MPSLQRLCAAPDHLEGARADLILRYLHDCRQLSVEAVIMAIVYRRLPRLSHLEAIWPLELLKEGEYNMLAKACAGQSPGFVRKRNTNERICLLMSALIDRHIQMTPAMTEHYAPLVCFHIQSLSCANLTVVISHIVPCRVGGEKESQRGFG